MNKNSLGVMNDVMFKEWMPCTLVHPNSCEYDMLVKTFIVIREHYK